MSELDKVKLQAMAVIDAAADEIIAIGEHIWNNPEPGYREYKTSEYIVKELENSA